MALSFLPTILTDRVTDLTPELLHRKGIRLLMLDFDNTIVPYTTDDPTEEMIRWLEEMNRSEIQLCIVSNSKKSRVPSFCSRYGLDCITHAKKPFSRGIRHCLARYGVSPGEAALAGDQVYTDVLGARCQGMTAILVRAIDNHNIWLKLRHGLELPILYFAKNRRLTK